MANLKYYILAGTLGAAVFGSTAVHYFDPMTIAERSGIFVVRQAVSAVARAGGDWFGSAGPFLEDRYYGLSMVFALFLAGILALEMLNRRFWCRHLCPLGAALSLVGRASWIGRRVAGCEATDICRSACVFGAVGDDPRATRSGECTLCLRCRRACPHGAISFGPRAAAVEPVSLDRRAFAGALIAGVVYATVPGGKTLSGRPRTRPIRPPGARPEDEFLAACTRCGACIGACLTGGLQPALFEAGVEGMWTPTLLGRLGGCEAECNLCGKVCNTRAIRYLPLEEKKKIKVGKAVIDRDLCLAWKEERVCYICDEVCPFGAVDFRREAGAIDKPAVSPAKCTGCGLCEWKCPVSPPAIYVIPLAEGTS